MSPFPHPESYTPAEDINYSYHLVLAALLCESQSKYMCQSFGLLSSAFTSASLSTEPSFFLGFFFFLSSITLVKIAISKFLPKHLVSYLAFWVGATTCAPLRLHLAVLSVGNLLSLQSLRALSLAKLLPLDNSCLCFLHWANANYPYFSSSNS